MKAGVDLRVVAGFLRDAEQRIDFRKQRLEGRTVAQHLDKYLGVSLAEGAPHFRPDALGGQGRQLPGLYDVRHQGQRFALEGKAPVGVASGKARRAQDAQRILGKGGRYVAQRLRFEVGAPPVGIDNRSILAAGHRVNGEIAAP